MSILFLRRELLVAGLDIYQKIVDLLLAQTGLTQAGDQAGHLRHRHGNPPPFTYYPHYTPPRGGLSTAFT